MTASLRIQLIAPCGMDCAVCSAYLAQTRNLPKKRGATTHCTGCRIRPKHCAYLKGHCRELGEERVRYCFECAKYPCAHLRHIDQRYRARYGMSFIENLETIRRLGVRRFIAAQQERFGCAECGALRCVHNGKCYRCQPPRAWNDGRPVLAPP